MNSTNVGVGYKYTLNHPTTVSRRNLFREALAALRGLGRAVSYTGRAHFAVEQFALWTIFDLGNRFRGASGLHSC